MTLRVAVFAHEFPALSETFVLNQITGLLDLGCDVRVFAAGRRDEPVCHTDVQRYGLLRRVKYPGMPKNRLKRIVASVPLLARGLRHRPRRTLQSLNIFRYGRAALCLELLYWSELLAESSTRFDVIFCHFGINGRRASFLREIGAIDGVLVTAFHGVDVSAVLSQRPGYYRHLFGHGDLFLPISQRWRDVLIRHGCDARRAEVHHMGVDLPRFPYRPGPDAPDGSLRILTVGRLVEKKGVADALRAVARLHEDGLPVRYTIVGDGPLRGTLEALTDELGLGQVVRFVGLRDQETVISLMLGHDVLLAPSVTDSSGDQEGIPVTLMEAMALGLPVVSTRHSGIPELVEDKNSGFLCAERDAEGLAGALRRMHGNPELRRTLSRNAREVVGRRFDVRALNKRLVSIFEALLEESPQTADRKASAWRRNSNGATPTPAASHHICI